MKEKQLKDSSFIFSGNVTFIQEIYRKYLQNPSSVSAQWQEYFKNVGDDFNSLASDFDGAPWNNAKSQVVGVSAEIVKSNEEAKTHDQSLSQANYNYKAARLIDHFRKYGHHAASLDPLELVEPDYHPALTLEYHGFEEEELHHPVYLPYKPNFSGLTTTQIIKKLRKIYCSNIAYEFEYISNVEEKIWLRDRIENDSNDLSIINNEDRSNALNHLHRAASFENLLHKKFPGAKRFSVEGGDVIIPAIEHVIKLSGEEKINNIELGMAHRGRLNVLTNICGKPYDQMIAEFKGASSIPEKYNASGDVKYHMGYSSDRYYGDHKLHVSLAYNPSHLEAVNSVVIGKTRAKQDIEKDTDRRNSLAILIHGDAAVIGQGSVAETFNMAYVDSFYVGGTIHFIINNQIGFTARHNDSRSTRYCSDVAKFIETPIIHVNGDNVESVLYACILAFEYRQKFGKDIVVDINCYRKYGHNEGDEPNYTQPVMYKKVKQMKSLDIKYADQLVNQKVITSEEFNAIKEKRHGELEEAFQKSDKFKAVKAHAFAEKWEGFTTKTHSKSGEIKTGVDKKNLSKLVKKLLSYPEDFKIHNKIKKQYDVKNKLFEEGTHLDWALGESLAYASLLEEGYPIRISGQDSKRGTFSHRHSVLRDIESEEEFIPLNHLSDKQEAKYLAIDSVLSEFSVLGFEYGYSLSTPHALCIWEGQFGDFANGAQIIIDQFITSGEAKWLRLSGMVLLLPHGYEGQGPEHSSARLERFLQSCAEENIQVVNCTTPANFYHVLRRQIHRDYRKPLVVMTPKSLLRHKLATSTISEFDKGTSFLPVIAEQDKLVSDKDVKKLIICSGKIYYDLYEARKAKEINNIAIIRLEELYPLPYKAIAKEIKKYSNAEIVWCQEEPQNMGAWNFIDRRLEAIIKDCKVSAERPVYVGRPEAASPATGYMTVHQQEQQEIINTSLKLDTD